MLYVAQNAGLPRHSANDCFFAFPVMDKRTAAKHHNHSSRFYHGMNGSETPFRGDVQSSISDSLLSVLIIPDVCNVVKTEKEKLVLIVLRNVTVSPIVIFLSGNSSAAKHLFLRQPIKEHTV